MASNSVSALPADTVEQDEMRDPSLTGDTNPPQPDSQVDVVADNPYKQFSASPESVEIAKAQGVAFLRATLNDPNGEIAVEILKVEVFKAQHSANDRCRKVQRFITGKEQVTEQTVVHILATWCLFGGDIPTIWVDPRTGRRGGDILEKTDWGQHMLDDLMQLQCGRKSGLNHCKAYAKGIIPPRGYNPTEAERELATLKARDLAKTKESKPKTPSSNTNKPKTPSSSANPASHSASSTRQSSVAERRKNTAMQQKEDGTDGESRHITGPSNVYLQSFPASSMNGLEKSRKKLRYSADPKSGHSSARIFRRWKDVLLVAHKLIDDHPDQEAQVQYMVAESARLLPNLEPESEKKFFRWFTKRLTKIRGQCPFCPVEYRDSDPCLNNGNAHDPQRFRYHLVNLCHDSAAEWKARRSIAYRRLGATFSKATNGQFQVKLIDLSNLYPKKISKKAFFLINDMKGWNNQLHRLDLTHKILDSANAGAIDKLKAEMLALRVCLQTNKIPTLVTEPTSMLEQVRYEVNALKLPEIRLDGLQRPAPEAQPEASSKPTEPASAANPAQNSGDQANGNQIEPLPASRKRPPPISAEHNEKFEQFLNKHPGIKRPRLSQETGTFVRAASITIEKSISFEGDSAAPALDLAHIQPTVANAPLGDATLQQQLASLEQQLTGKNQQVTSLQQQLTDNDQQVTRLEQRVTSLQQRLTGKEKQLAEKDRQIAETDKRLESADPSASSRNRCLSSQLAHTMIEFDRYMEEFQRLNQDRPDVMTALKNIQEVARKQSEELATLKTRQTMAAAEKAGLDLRLINAELELDNVKLELLASNNENSRLSKLEAEIKTIIKRSGN